MIYAEKTPPKMRKQSALGPSHPLVIFLKTLFYNYVREINKIYSPWFNLYNPVHIGDTTAKSLKRNITEKVSFLSINQHILSILIPHLFITSLPI